MNNCTNVEVIDCTMAGCTDGIDVTASNNDKIVQNNCSSDQNGIVLVGTNMTVYNNTCCHDSTYGIEAANDMVANNTITMNNCSHDSVGICLFEANDSVINNICCFDVNGIFSNFGLGAHITITQNNCSKNTNDGISILDTGDTMSSNTCNGNGNDGIDSESGKSANNTITQNICFDNNCGIYICEANDTVSDNTFCNSTAGGVGILCAYADAARNTFTQNNCSNNKGVGLLLLEANDTVSDNTCCSNTVDGIESFYDAIANNTITQNNCSLNGVFGIYLEEANDNVSGNTCSKNIFYGMCLTCGANSSMFTGNWFLDNGKGSVVLNYTAKYYNLNNIFSQNQGIITANATGILAGGTVQFSNWITDQASMSFQWDFKDGTPNSTAANATHIFNTVGTFNVTVAISDTNGNRVYETITVVVGVPGAPSVTATSGNGQVVLAWDAVSSGGGSILHYNVYQDGTNITSSVAITKTSTGWTCTVTGLKNGQTYSFQVSAVNAAGEGPLSTAVKATPNAPVVSFGDTGIIAIAAMVGIASVIASILSKKKRSYSF
jgi:parallel beta-helix repeat protein